MDELVERLREHYEWALGNEWETPITLSDDLEASINVIEELLKTVDKQHKDLIFRAE